jgi:hypothetical protein
MMAARGGVSKNQWGLLAVLAVLTFVASLWAFPARSAAEAVIGEPGSGAGQYFQPQGVAVDRDEDLLYVSDGENARVDVFDATTGEFVKAFGWGVLDGSNELQVCTIATTCQKGIKGSGAGQFTRPKGIAVDNDPLSPGFHSIYVYENFRVQKFTPAGEFVWMVGGEVNKTTSGDLCTAASGDVCGAGVTGNDEGHFNEATGGGVVAVGPGGVVYVGDQLEGVSPRPSRIQKFSPSGAHLGQLVLPVSGGAGRTNSVAVDSAGNIYVGTSGGNGAVRKYDPSGNELYALDHPSFNITAVAVDLTNDHVFIADNTTSPAEGEGSTYSIFEYDETGAQVRTFYGSLDRRALGLAPYSPNLEGDIFAVEDAPEGQPGRILAIPFPPPGPVVDPRDESTFADPVTNTKATLHAKVNPEGESTTYHFEYITDEDFVAAGETFGPGTLETPESAPVGSDFNLHYATEDLTGLFPETLYHYRLVATNASGENSGPTETFTTKDPLEFGDAWTADVTTDEATLVTEVNPLGIPATARFEYVELSQWDPEWTQATQVPASSEAPIDLGEGEEMKDVSVQIAGLQPGTAYRFRMVATNRCKPEPAPLCDFGGPEIDFTTFAPLEERKGCANDAFREAGLGTFLPDCRGYEMVSPVDKEGADVAPIFNVNGYLAGLDQAAVDGGSITYSSYKAFGDVESAPYTDQYLARRDGNAGWVSEAISPKREGPSLMMYLSAALDRQYKAFNPDLCSGWVVQDAKPTLAPGAIEGYPGLYRRDNCDPGTGGYEAITKLQPPETELNLPPLKFIPEMQGATPDGSVTIFVVNDNLIDGMPNQPAACENEPQSSTEHCVGRLYEARAGNLNYVCVLPDGTPVSGPCAAGTPSGSLIGRTSNVSNAISDDGSRIFWSASSQGPGPLYVRIDGSQPSAETVEISSTPAQFWTAASDGSTAIYSRGEELFEFDVDAETETEIAEGFKGFAGASEDATRVYFASTKVLTGEEENSAGGKAESGEPNLYLYEAGAGFRFVGTLVSSDLQSATQASSPIAASPVARLSRVTPDGQSIAFMSSARLTGYDNLDADTKETDMTVFLYDADANAGEGAILCPSCNPTGARPEGQQLTQKLMEDRRAAARIPTFQSQLYGARVLSDDGNRLYFNSFDPLVPIDINGEEDVYQWQAAGTGECTGQSPTFHQSAAGCIDLISTGESTEGSELTDISADGNDVFFKTRQSILSQDPGRMDIYDARVGGGFAPLPPEPPICVGEGCQDPEPTPQAPSPATGATAPGNPTWPVTSCRKGFRKVHRKGKVVCVKVKRCRKGTHKVKRKGKVRCVKNKNNRNGGRRAGR